MPAPIPKRQIDWQPVRDAFIKRPTKPSYEELSEEFAISYSTIGNASADEGWPVLRAAYLDTQLQKAGASEIILNALGASKAITDKGATFVVIALDALIACLQDQKLASLAASTRSDIVQTCSFAWANIAKGARECGIIGFPRQMQQAGADPSNGRWNPDMLQQINVTVNALTAAQQAQQPAKAESGPAVDVPSSAPGGKQA